MNKLVGYPLPGRLEAGKLRLNWVYPLNVLRVKGMSAKICDCTDDPCLIRIGILSCADDPDMSLYRWMQPANMLASVMSEHQLALVELPQ